MFYVGFVTWFDCLLMGVVSAMFINDIKNGVMSFDVVIIKVFILFN
jgi:hypothetical protein